MRLIYSTNRARGAVWRGLAVKKSLATTFFERAELLSDREAVRYKENKSPYKSMTWTALARLVKEMAAGLVDRGVEAGDRVAILSQTSHLWAAADLATISSAIFLKLLFFLDRLDRNLFPI